MTESQRFDLTIQITVTRTRAGLPVSPAIVNQIIARFEDALFSTDGK